MDPRLALILGAVYGALGLALLLQRRRFRAAVDNLYRLQGRGSQFQYVLQVTISFLIMSCGVGLVVFGIVRAIIS